jgi:hypothetical protein
VENLHAEAERLHAYVIDVRVQPYSKQPEWLRQHLEAKLPRYKWVRDFGNENYRGGPIKLVNYDAGRRKIAPLVAEGWSLILLCMCWNVDECHRAVVAERLAQDEGWRVEHLARAGESAKKEPRSLRLW